MLKIKKYVALALAILISFSSFVLHAVAVDGDAAKIEALKTAWSMLEERVLELRPGAGSGGNVTPIYSDSTDISHLPDSASESLPQFIGSRYVKAVLTGSDSEATSYDAGTDYIKYGSAMQSVIGYNVYLSFYTEELNGSLSFVPWFRQNTNGVSRPGNGTGKVYNVTESDVGKWVTLKTEDLTSDNYAGAVSNYGNSIVIYMSSSGENTIYFGCFILTRNIELPENSDDWGLAQWVIAAKNLDTSDLYNTEAFNEALAEAETEDVKQVITIRNAWDNLQEELVTVLATSDDYTIHNGSTAFERISVLNTSSLPIGAREDIPIKYIGGSFNKITLNAAENYLSSFLRYSNTPEDIDIKGGGIYLSLYVNTTLEDDETISLLPYYRDTTSGIIDYSSPKYTKEYVITPENTGKWITLSGNEITPDGKMTVSKITNNLLLSVKSPKQVEIIFGNIIITKSHDLPDGYEKWNFDAAYEAASSLDLSRYFNTSDMEEVLGKLDPQKRIRLQKLKNAWGKMEVFAFEVEPVGNMSFHKGLTDISISEYERGLNDPQIMSSKIITATVTSGDDTTPHSGPMSNYILYNVSYEEITGLNVYLNFYAEELNGTFSFVPFFRKSGGSTGIDTGKLYTVTQNDLGHWIALGKEEITDQRNYPKVSDLGNKIVLGINTTETNTFSFGNFVFTRNVTLPEDSENWSYEDWVAHANALDISDYWNTEEFVYALESVNGGIYGEELTSRYALTYGDFSSNMMKGIGYNLLSKDRVDLSVKINGASTASSGKKSDLYDFNSATGYAVSSASWNTGEDSSKYCDIYYDLGDIYRINKLFINHWAQKYLENGAYEVYVSNSVKDLFNAESKVFEYDNRANSKNGTSVSQLIEFLNENRPVGRYVSFRVTCPFSDYQNAKISFKGLLYLRVSELGVYGERLALPKTNYQNLLNDKSDVSIYTMNYSNKTFTTVGDYENKQYSHLMLKSYISDGNPNTVYDIYAGKYGESSIDIVVNLGDSLVVDELILKGGSDENHWPEEMKLYVGYSYSDVCSADSIAIHTFNQKTADGVYSYKMAPKDVCYIRFQITKAVHPDYVAHMLAVISEIEIMGYAENDGEALTGKDYGDLNSDGEISIFDLVRMKKRLVNNVNYWIIADLNKDGIISNLDMAFVRMYLLGTIHKF